MYDMVRTKQSLPSEMYRLLLGTALSVARIRGMN